MVGIDQESRMHEFYRAIVDELEPDLVGSQHMRRVEEAAGAYIASSGSTAMLLILTLEEAIAAHVALVLVRNKEGQAAADVAGAIRALEEAFPEIKLVARVHSSR